MDGTGVQGLDRIEASLNYLAPTAERPFAYAYAPPPRGRPQRSGEAEAHRVTIRNGRPLIPSLSLDREGFTLVRRATQVSDFTDEAAVRSVYYPEVERLVKEATGAVRVAIFDHTLRNAAKRERDGSAVREAVQRVHNDYTVRSGPQRVRDLFPASEAEALLKHRFAMINVWRPIGHTVHDMPLAVADAASVAFEDLVPSDLIYRDRIGETYGVTYSPRHRWFYFPDMEPDEALLIKVYDSDATRARFSVHTAFADPTAPADAAPRESIEVRTFAFFAPGANDPVPDGPSGLAG
ncbi:MAG TPA: CmcJ/NvfI family oxidoreductase [Alphaproteobacteria bacterium]